MENGNGMLNSTNDLTGNDVTIEEVEEEDQGHSSYSLKSHSISENTIENDLENDNISSINSINETMTSLLPSIKPRSAGLMDCTAAEEELFNNYYLVWMPIGRKAVCWSFYTILRKDRGTEILRCIICDPQNSNYNDRGTSSRKGLIKYNQTSGSTALKRHVENHHKPMFLKLVELFSKHEQTGDVPASAFHRKNRFIYKKRRKIGEEGEELSVSKREHGELSDGHQTQSSNTNSNYLKIIEDLSENLSNALQKVEYLTRKNSLLVEENETLKKGVANADLKTNLLNFRWQIPLETLTSSENFIESKNVRVGGCSYCFRIDFPHSDDDMYFKFYVVPKEANSANVLQELDLRVVLLDENKNEVQGSNWIGHSTFSFVDLSVCGNMTFFSRINVNRWKDLFDSVVVSTTIDVVKTTTLI